MLFLFLVVLVDALFLRNFTDYVQSILNIFIPPLFFYYFYTSSSSYSHIVLFLSVCNEYRDFLCRCIFFYFSFIFRYYLIRKKRKTRNKPSGNCIKLLNSILKWLRTCFPFIWDALSVRFFTSSSSLLRPSASTTPR